MNISNNLRFISANENWIHLNNFQKNIDLSFLDKSNFKTYLKILDKKMFDLICDDSWMGHCANYQLKSGGKRFRGYSAF